ncbi:MAG: hypothetical protein QOH57_4717 [Mycobacterium sp.]|nr:hypothetical protein [Mycobacterium sp.]
MNLKSLTTGVAAATLVGAAALGVTSISSVPATTSPAITPVVFGAPLPLDVDPSLTGEFTGILNQLANTGKVSDKGNLIQGGIGLGTGIEADRQLKKAQQKGQLPLSFSLTPPNVNGDQATTMVTATAPTGKSVNQPMTFVNEDGWKLSKTSALAIVSAVMG